jgi:hypothetical protein
MRTSTTSLLGSDTCDRQCKQDPGLALSTALLMSSTWYIPVYASCIAVCTGTFWYILDYLRSYEVTNQETDGQQQHFHVINSHQTVILALHQQAHRQDTSMLLVFNRYVLVCTGIYWYVLACTGMYQYIPVHTIHLLYVPVRTCTYLYNQVQASHGQCQV